MSTSDQSDKLGDWKAIMVKIDMQIFLLKTPMLMTIGRLEDHLGM
jgi:hypothetical protein